MQAGTGAVAPAPAIYLLVGVMVFPFFQGLFPSFALLTGLTGRQ